MIIRAADILSSFKTVEVGAMAQVEGSRDAVALAKKALTVTSTGRIPYTLELFKEFGGKFYIPRTFADGRQVTGQWDRFTITPKITLRPEQVKMVAEYLTAVKTYSPYGGIIKSAPGTGKTVIGVSLLCHFGYKTLIIVPTDRLMDQWRERLKTFSNLCDDEIGIIRQNKCDVENKVVVIGMIHSLAKAKTKYPHIAELFGFVIWDECLHPSHEILTRDGWKSVSRVTLKDHIAQVDGYSGEISFSQPSRVISKEYVGNLVGFKGKSVDLLATPNHEHLVYWNDEVIPQKVQYKDITTNNRWSQRLGGQVEGTDRLSTWEKFLIAFQADGQYLRQLIRTGEHHLRFAFRRQRKVVRLENLLQGIEGTRWTKTVNTRGDICIQVWTVKKPTKFLDWILFTKSSTYYKEILEEAVQWDGWTQRACGHYESKEHLNTEIMQIVALLAGKVGRRLFIPNLGYYRIFWSNGPKGKNLVRALKGSHKYYYPYTGIVYCVTVPKGNIVTRRNGKISVTGNCQVLGANTFASTAGFFNSKYRLALSATPRRKDGMDAVFLLHIGQVVSENKKIKIHPRIILQTYPGFDTSHSGFVWRGELNTGRYLNKIASSIARNNMIANAIITAYLKGRDVLVLSDRLKQLEYLKQIIQVTVKPEDIGLFTGQTKQLDRKILLATYGSASMGADLPRLSTLIFATPRVDIVQSIGRICRDTEGRKHDPVVIDIIDGASSIMRNWAKARLKLYKKYTEDIVGTI